MSRRAARPSTVESNHRTDYKNFDRSPKYKLKISRLTLLIHQCTIPCQVKTGANKVKGSAILALLTKDQQVRERAEREFLKMKELVRSQNNGIRAPLPSSMCCRIWGLATSMSQQCGRVVTLRELTEKGISEGFNRGSLRNQYTFWRKYHGLPPVKIRGVSHLRTVKMK